MIRKDLVLQCVATHGLEIRTTNLLAFPELSSGRQCEKEGFGRATKGIAFEVLKLRIFNSCGSCPTLIPNPLRW
jgi:hypothetical protein